MYPIAFWLILSNKIKNNKRIPPKLSNVQNQFEYIDQIAETTAVLLVRKRAHKLQGEFRKFRTIIACGHVNLSRAAQVVVACLETSAAAIQCARTHTHSSDSRNGLRTNKEKIRYDRRPRGDMHMQRCRGHTDAQTRHVIAYLKDTFRPR